MAKVPLFDRKCKVATDGKHQWANFEGKDKNGNLFTFSVCKECGERP